MWATQATLEPTPTQTRTWFSARDIHSVYTASSHGIACGLHMTRHLVTIAEIMQLHTSHGHTLTYAVSSSQYVVSLYDKTIPTVQGRISDSRVSLVVLRDPTVLIATLCIFLPSDATQSMVLPWKVVCPSVCLSVTLRYRGQLEFLDNNFTAD